jgi:hypothetical protein
MKALLIMCVSSLLFLSNNAAAKDLKRVADKNLIYVLNNFEIISEVKQPPLLIRIIRLAEHGECDGKPQTCPKQMLYIAVSTFDEAPEQALYELPKSFGWEFLSWKAVPKEEGRDYFVVFEVREKIVSSSPDKGWWEKSRYEIGVNPWKSYIKEIQ